MNAEKLNHLQFRLNRAVSTWAPLPTGFMYDVKLLIRPIVESTTCKDQLPASPPTQSDSLTRTQKRNRRRKQARLAKREQRSSAEEAKTDSDKNTRKELRKARNELMRLKIERQKAQLLSESSSSSPDSDVKTMNTTVWKRAVFCRRVDTLRRAFPQLPRKLLYDKVLAEERTDYRTSCYLELAEMVDTMKANRVTAYSDGDHHHRRATLLRESELNARALRVKDGKPRVTEVKEKPKNRSIVVAPPKLRPPDPKPGSSRTNPFWPTNDELVFSDFIYD